MSAQTAGRSNYGIAIAATARTRPDPYQLPTIPSEPFFQDALCEAFQQIIEHADDNVPCFVPDCAAEVEWVCLTRCCGRSFLLCGPHRDAAKHRTIRARSYKCGRCGFRFFPFPSYEEIFRTEVRL